MQQGETDWRRERGRTLRVEFECCKDGAELWTVSGEVAIHADNPVEIAAR